MTTLPNDLLACLREHDQEHVLLDWDALDSDARAALVYQLAAIDFVQLEALRKHVSPPGALPERFRPISVTPAAFTDDEKARGSDALRNGKVAALLVAGGQGSRLGMLQPKGLFPAAPLSGMSLYQLHAEKVFALSCRYQRPIPFLVMTSPATDLPTRAFFAEKEHFNLVPD